jgi:hypothetical protein
MPYEPKYPFREELLARQYAIPLHLKTHENSQNKDGLCKTDQKQLVREIITLLAIIALIAVMFLFLLLLEPTPHKKKGGATHACADCFAAEWSQAIHRYDTAGV